MTDFKQIIARAIVSKLNGFSTEQIESFLEQPPKPEMGDWALPCFRLSKQLQKSPQQIASELAQVLENKISEVEKIEVAGGYLNFFVQKKVLAKATIVQVLKQKQKFGLNQSQKGKKVLIEFSAPNTNKPLHIGHVRNNCLGMALTNILRANGCRVIPVNLLNDRGVHICKTMLAYQKWGKNQTPALRKQKPDHFLGDLYVQFDHELKKNPELEKQVQVLLQKWEEKDHSVRALWKKMNAWAIAGMKQTYKEYGVKFDKWYLESAVYDKARSFVELGLKTGVFEKKEDGAIVAVLETYGLPNKTVLRSDGTSIYLTQDLALTKQKFSDFGFDEALWVVASEQNLYFEQLFKIFELLKVPWAGKCQHVNYGLVQLPSGRMKSREGTVVDADDLLSEMKKVAQIEIQKRYSDLSKKETQKRVDAIALAAIKFFMLKIDAKKDFTFNPEDSISFEGETGPYVLYAYARAKSILRKAFKQSSKPDFSVLKTDSEKKLVLVISGFPSVVQNVSKTLSPHSLAQFLVELAQAFNSFYHQEPVLNAKQRDLKVARLALVQATALTLCSGLHLLDISALEKM